MHAQRRETKEQVGPTLCFPSLVKDSVPNSAAISDDDSVVSSVQFAVNIQNPRENLGMIMMMVLSTFLDLLLH
jgi:hypothetical protein